MMKLNTTSLLSFGVVLVLSGTLWCQDSKKTYKDVIFVKQLGKEGVYSKTTGWIVALNSSEMIMETEGKRLLYTREVVKRANLDKNREDDYEKIVRIIEAIREGRYLIKKKEIKNVKLYEKSEADYQELADKIEAIQGGRLSLPEEVFKGIMEDKISAERYQEYVDIYWNKEKSLIVAALQKTPYLGPFFSFLDYLPGTSGTFLAVLILLSILSYGVYRLYQMFIVATNLRNLNRTKLNMEISKLHYEIESMKKKLGFTEEIAPYKVKTPKIDLDPILYSFKLPEVHLLTFLKHKMFRMLTEEEKLRRTDLWQKKWQAYRDLRGYACCFTALVCQ